MAVLQSIIAHIDMLPDHHGEDDYSKMLNTIATTHNMAVGKMMRLCRNVITGGKVYSDLVQYIMCCNVTTVTGWTKGSNTNECYG